MMMCGTNIQSPTDTLKKVKEDYLFHSLTNPKPALVSKVEQLRIVYSIDSKRYAKLKRQLPYVVCGTFTPPCRQSVNFAYTETFFLDFDHLTAKGLSLDVVRGQMAADPHVMMCFASPSRDGLKVLLRLKERCYDKGLYSIFYKTFARRFAMRHNLGQVIDERTSDVTRACFISIDPDAYYNEQAETIDLSRYVDTSDPTEIADIRQEQKEHEAMQKKTVDEEPSRQKDPDKDVMNQIRQRLNPRTTKKREIIVPRQLEEIMEALKEFIEQTGIIVTNITNIQYAKKIQARLGLRHAEVNLFFGHRGYSVVISPRRGTDDELNDLLALTVRSFLDNN